MNLLTQLPLYILEFATTENHQINNRKLMEPAQKSDFSLLRLEQTQKQTDML